jgi:hypothetical protein
MGQRRRAGNRAIPTIHEDLFPMPQYSYNISVIETKSENFQEMQRTELPIPAINSSSVYFRHFVSLFVRYGTKSEKGDVKNDTIPTALCTDLIEGGRYVGGDDLGHGESNTHHHQ